MLARGGNMRVIGGLKRGFKLACPPGMRVRPTADRVREAMFNILASYVVAASVLDLMAGTGALGIEAVSRGARRAVFVDNHFYSVSITKYNFYLWLVPSKTVIKGCPDFLREHDRSSGTI